MIIVLPALPPPPPPVVFEMPAEELNQANSPWGNISPVSHDDTNSDKPMTAKEAIDALYKEKILSDESEKEKLITKLGKLEEKNSQIPRHFYRSVTDIAEKQIFSAEDFNTLVYDLSPLAALRAGRLVLNAFKHTRKLSIEELTELKDKAAQVLEVFLTMPEDELNAVLANLK